MTGLRGVLALLAFCTACSTAPNPLATMEKRTSDGLVLVEDRRHGALFIKPDHGITPHHRYHLNQVLLTYDRDSSHFSKKQEERMRSYVEDGVIGEMTGRGRTMVTGPGQCVLKMGIGLVDVELLEPDGTGSATSMLATWGGVTLVVDLRDSLTNEPLLRYGRRIHFPGGIQWQKDRPPWVQVRTALDRAVAEQTRLLTEKIPPSTAEDTHCLPPDPELTAQLASHPQG